LGIQLLGPIVPLGTRGFSPGGLHFVVYSISCGGRTWIVKRKTSFVGHDLQKDNTKIARHSKLENLIFLY
jgi:hypothetical protein